MMTIQSGDISKLLKILARVLFTFGRWLNIVQFKGHLLNIVQFKGHLLLFRRTRAYGLLFCLGETLWIGTSLMREWSNDLLKWWISCMLYHLIQYRFALHSHIIHFTLVNCDVVPVKQIIFKLCSTNPFDCQ